MISEEVLMDYDYDLFLGYDIAYQNIVIKQLKLREIKELGLSKVLRRVNFCAIDKDGLFETDCDELSKFSLFELVLMFDNLREMFLDFMEMFVRSDNIDFGSDTNSFYIECDGKVGILGKENFDEFLEVVRLAYCLEAEKKESDREDIDEEMRQMLKDFEEEEDKIRKMKTKGKTVTINSLIQAICCKHPSINHLNVGESTLYQLKKEYARLMQIDANVYINTGIYTGNVSPKDINIEDYNWAKEV